MPSKLNVKTKTPNSSSRSRSNLDSTSIVHLKHLNIASFAVTILGNIYFGAFAPATITTISKDYPVILQPAGTAFSIWSVIYSLLIILNVLQFCPAFSKNSESMDLLVNKIGYWFVASNVFNVLWLFLYCYQTLETLWLSSLALTGIAGTVLTILFRAQSFRSRRASLLDFIFIDVAFSIYGGWVTIATLLNWTISVYASGWFSSYTVQQDWAYVTLVVAFFIYFEMMLKQGNYVYPLVYSWAVYWISKKPENNPKFNTVAFGLSFAMLVVIAIYVVYTLNMTKNKGDSEEVLKKRNNKNNLKIKIRVESEDESEESQEESEESQDESETLSSDTGVEDDERDEQKEQLLQKQQKKSTAIDIGSDCGNQIYLGHKKINANQYTKQGKHAKSKPIQVKKVYVNEGI